MGTPAQETSGWRECFPSPQVTPTHARGQTLDGGRIVGGGHWVAGVPLPTVGHSQEPRGSLCESPQSSSWWLGQSRGWTRTGLGVAQQGPCQGCRWDHIKARALLLWNRTHETGPSSPRVPPMPHRQGPSQEDQPNTSPEASVHSGKWLFPVGQTVPARGERNGTPSPGCPPLPTGPGDPCLALREGWDLPAQDSP